METERNLRQERKELDEMVMTTARIGGSFIVRDYVPWLSFIPKLQARLAATVEESPQQHPKHCYEAFRSQCKRTTENCRFRDQRRWCRDSVVHTTSHDHNRSHDGARKDESIHWLEPLWTVAWWFACQRVQYFFHYRAGRLVSWLRNQTRSPVMSPFFL